MTHNNNNNNTCRNNNNNNIELARPNAATRPLPCNKLNSNNNSKLTIANSTRQRRPTQFWPVRRRLPRRRRRPTCINITEAPLWRKGPPLITEYRRVLFSIAHSSVRIAQFDGQPLCFLIAVRGHILQPDMNELTSSPIKSELLQATK